MPRMDEFNRLEAKGLARAKIRARRRRVGSIRSRTIRGSLALFALAWAIVFGQLVTGNDPALSSFKAPRKTLASSHEKPLAEVEVEPEFEEPEPEPEFVPEPEPEPEPEPAPVITSSS